MDSAISLNLAFFVNAAILVMAAAVFFRTGHHEVAQIQDAHRMLEPLLGAAIAPIAFAVALLASGQSSTITGTLAGQIIMEGYLNLRIRPWLRRLITRLLAVVPAVLTVLYFGEGSTGALLVLSQVVLSLQLPFAIIPLIHFVADRKRMGTFAIGSLVQALAWLVAGIVVVLNVKLVIAEVGGWLDRAGDGAWLLSLSMVPLALAVAALLLYVSLKPFLDRLWVRPFAPVADIHRTAAVPEVRLARPQEYERVVIALDFAGGEEQLINEALRFADQARTAITLAHVVESPVARAMGADAADTETAGDEGRLAALCGALGQAGYSATWHLGLGDPVAELARLITEEQADAVLLGAHGHRGIADLIHGTTADALRHRLSATVILVPLDSRPSPS